VRRPVASETASMVPPADGPVPARDVKITA